MDRDQLEVLTEARVLADIDRFFALSMADLGAGPEVVLSAAAVSAMHRAGHTCLPLAEAGKPLAELVERPSSEDGEEVPEHALAIRLPARAAWRAALAASPVVAGGTTDPPRPLVLDRDRLYLHRLFEAESGLAARMHALAADVTPMRPRRCIGTRVRQPPRTRRPWLRPEQPSNAGCASLPAAPAPARPRSRRA